MKKIKSGLAVIFFCSTFSGDLVKSTENKTWGETFLEKVEKAQKDLKEVDLAFEVTQRVWKTKSKNSKRPKETREEIVVSKQIALRAWDTSENQLFTIMISVPHPAQSTFRFEVLTSGYVVEHVAGRGVGRLVFRAWKGEKELIILAKKQWQLPLGFSDSVSSKVFKEKAEEIIYTPSADSLYSKEAVVEGYKFLRGAIEKARTNLISRKVMSRALPRKLLGNMAQEDFILNFALNEQMDHTKFFKDATRTADNVLIEYAYNKEKAFTRSISTANALGPYQFTNNGKSDKPGTYDTIVRTYEKVGLNPNFQEGARDLQNIIKAATALLDMELAKFPLEVRALFEENYRIGGFYLASCYNEGFGKLDSYSGCSQMYKWIKKNKYKISLKENVPLGAFIRYKPVNGKKLKKIINLETYVYLQKYRFLWSYLDKRKEQLE